MKLSVATRPARTIAHADLEPIAQAFRSAGAVSPADAGALTDIPGTDAAAVVALVARGIVREGPPGRYYLHAGGLHERRDALLRTVLIVAGSVGLLAGLPLLAVYFTR